MDILYNFKRNGYFTAELYHLLAKNKLVDPKDEIIPSQYEREMRMDTQRRLQNLNNIDIDNIVETGRKSKSVVLSFVPRLIIFQNFKPNDKIIAKFTVKNISTGPTHLNMVFKESSYFFIKPCGGQLMSRLAPGMSTTFAVTFTPIQHEDYVHKVTFYTDTDKYILPIIAMGPRAVFDFPDKINIPSIPLKIQNEVFVTIRNIGTASAGFTLDTRCPFSVQPKSAYLSPKEKIDIRIKFKTMNLGETRGKLHAILETGEIFTIDLMGTTHIVSVAFEKEAVRFLDTYNTMVRQQTYKIINKSNNLLTYMCMKNDCVYYDFEEKIKLATMFYNVKESESAKYAKLVQYDVLSSEEHERVYTRIFFDEIQALVADETLYFQNTHFSITPIKGNLWPNQATELTITFSPKEIGEFTATVYLDIDGVSDRVPLKLTGTSLPPSISLNLETLDMDRVYINTTYHYEIVAVNRGHINGVIVYKEVTPLFGSTIKCSPVLHCLRPGDKETFIISFCNSNQGPYFEEINFTIRDTDVVLKLYLKGEVIYPSLMFSVPCLDFGNVSLGVPKTLELDVINESVVHVNGTVKISSDGPEISSMRLTDYAVADIPKPEIPQWPREFNIEPFKMNIAPESKMSLKVTLTANLVRTHHTSLELELEKSDSPPIVLPVMYNALVPEIEPASDIKLRACFIDFSYEDEIIVKSNEFWGYFTLEEPEEESTLQVDVAIKEGYIEPNSAISLPVTIRTGVLGVQEFYVRLKLFGLSKATVICHVTACGIRPIVTCSPMTLHWGQVKLLTRTQKTLTLCNDSPVNVYFKASLLNKDGRWEIQPADGYIEPESETDLLLSLYLIDAATYTNKAVIQLEKVKDILVPLSATGIGTSIIVGELRDRIVLGRHFTKIPLNCKVTMENCGTRMHALEWTEHYKAPKIKQLTTGFFTLDPKVLKLSAGEKLELSITGSSSKVTTVKEIWYLVGSVEGINKKELLLECEISVEFVDPKIEVSSSVIELQYDYGPYSEFYKLTDIITIKNVSKLPLDIEINIKPPFAIIQKQSTYKILPEEQNLCCCICYNESDLNILNIMNELGPCQRRSFVDFLTLKPVEPNCKEPLHFFEDINKIKMVFNLTHSIEQLLEDQEVMKIQILFDVTKHLSLKSRVYCDSMKIKFKGHKNKDAIRIIGKVNFPNICVLSPRVDFQCILNGNLESKSIKIQNITPLLVCYRFQWKKFLITANNASEQSNIERPINISHVKSLPDVTEAIVSKVHDIIPCQTLSVSNIEKITEHDDFHKQIVSPLYDRVFNMSTSLNNVVRDLESKKLQIIKTIAPMIEYDAEYDTEIDWTYKFPKKTRSNISNVNDVFLLTPHRGLLKPNEIQYVHVMFRPQQNKIIRALLECEVLGGPTETILITGQSSDLMYKINTQKINFKIKSFHEQAIELLRISNEAQLPFEFKTYLSEPKLQNELEATIINLLPTDKVLEAQEEVEIKVVMRTGVVGYFNRVFLLEIGHLPHIPIEVFGWGVIPQVYLTLPRSERTKMYPETEYLAIATLSIEYLDAISEIFIKPFSEHLNSPLIEKCFDDPDFQNDWHICSSCDGYPSKMDIELAIERMLVMNHIQLRPEILTTYSTISKMASISGFHTTPYVIDYGVVITGSTVQCTVDIVNYGPIATKLHYAKGTHVPGWLRIKLCGKLNPGETGKMEVVFSPTSNDFVELEENVETSFNFEVPYGVTIPIQIKALCAVPYLVTNVKEICFGTVRCGNKVILSIPLKNIGKPTCIWYVTLKLKAPGPNPMMVMDSSGKYEPGEGGWLSLSFKPNLEMLYEGMLIFRFHMNPNRLTIPVTGQGIIPRVHIIGPNVKFSPTLPWSESTDMYFGLTNPCPFPIELIIAHSDKKWKEEEDVYQLLYKYYNKPEEILVPVIRHGDGLPREILIFYSNFTERLKKAADEESVAARAVSAKASAAVKKLVKSPKNAPKPSTPKDATPRKFRTEAEIIADEFKMMKENHVDPLKECLQVFDHVPSDSGIEKFVKGLIIFMHGSPCEEKQCQEMAYTLGKKLHIPTLNIDNCIVEALCVCECSAKFIIMTAIKECYEMSQKGGKGDTVDDEQNREEILNEREDNFDVIFKKIEFLASNRNIGTPRSKVSDKRKKKSPNSSIASHSVLGAMGSTTMFQMELIQELLTDYFKQSKFNKGFIIDSLTSILIKSPPLVLSTVLKCKRSIRNINLVLCQSDFYKWAQSYEESQRQNDLDEENISKVYDESEIENIIQLFEDMTDEEYANASSELKNLYVCYGLEERRRKYYDKIGLPIDSAKKEKSSKVTDHSKSLLAVDTSESKKKIKKEDIKAKPTSEYLVMNTKYNEYYKNTYENLINMANNWILDECEIGIPLYGFNGQVVGTAQKKTKKKSDVQIIQVSEVNFSERGFPLILITCPCLQYKEALVNMFLTSPTIQEVLKEEEEFDILYCPMHRKEFTVILPKTFPKIHYEDPLKWCFLDESSIKKCECNQLTDLNLLDDSTQDNVLNILSKWHCTCAKKVAPSQTSTSEIPTTSIENVVPEEDELQIFYPLSLRKVKSMPVTSGRLILQPGDLVRCKYSFAPQVEGNFSVKRYIEVSGWPDSRVDINVNGICDLPRLDSRPKKMFNNFVRRTVDDNVYRLCYLDDLKLFEFGPIFVGNQRVYEEEYIMDLKNSSLITAEVDIEFQEETSVFQIDKTFIRLEPGCRGKLIITAAPSEVGVSNSILLLCVKDNPEIITINVRCTGVVPIVEILPLTKTIEYGKLLLYRREDDRFIVKNESILPILWRIRNTQEFLEDFIVAQTSGIIPRHDNHVVPITYIACKVGVISHKTLTIDIYDAEGRGEPMLVDNLYLSAECYDVTVECAYENPAETFLNYGNVKVNSTVVREMYLLNRGKYNIYFKLKKVKNFPEPSLLKSFEVTPEYGLIPATLKLTTIEFECTPTTSLNLINVPTFICSLLDGSKDQVVVAKFPVCVTIASFYNTFTLFPLGELNFHIIPVGSGVVREVILNNTSKCPFTYEIILPPKYKPNPDAPPVSLKGKDNKIKNPPLKCGNFIIMNDDNLLAPGTSRTLHIQFMATAAKKFEETINFIISDTCPAEAQGVPLKLVGTGAMPTLDIWNIETTFREHLIVKDLSEYKVPESIPHCVFVENSVTLHFFCVTVKTNFTGTIDLYNNGLVACALTMKLHYQSDSNNEIFYLDKYETHIEPLLHKYLGIIFSPKALKEYRAVLEIKLKLLDNQEQSFKICLIGKGVIPRIHMVSPPTRQQRMSLLQFPVTCLGSVNSKAIRFKNISPVKSIVVIDIIQQSQESRPVFWLSTAVNTEQMILLGNNDFLNASLNLILKPDEIATINVHYSPLKKGRISCDVKLSIVDNPYEYFTVLCEAEAFLEDVILIGLEMLSMNVDLDTYMLSTEGTISTVSTFDGRKKTRSAPIDKKKTKQIESKKSKRISVRSLKQSGSSSLDSSVLKYVLDFGGCEIFSIQKRSVIMANNSDKLYKFTWGEVEHIVINPSTGYISPGEEKDLEITFFSGQPISLKKLCVHCSLVGISDDALTIDMKSSTWDNRQTITLFDHNRDISVNERFETITQEQVLSSETYFGTINIIIVCSAITEYTKYSCTLKDEYDFEDTFIYQTRTFEFKVDNIGNVPLKIIWSFQIDDEFPKRIDKDESEEAIEEQNHGGSINDSTNGGVTEANRLALTCTDEQEQSKLTLFSGSEDRRSIDTWFEVNIPFRIEPVRECLKANESKIFKVTFSPLEAFDYRVRLKSCIDNLDPYDQNVSCKITAKSLIPYCHLDIEESDYLTSGRRKTTGVALPSHIKVLEFNVLGSGCYKKTFNVINPTSEAYEFIFEMVMSEKPSLTPVHCDMLKGYVEGGTSAEVTFTFSPTAPGVYECQWRFMIPVHNLAINLLVVGIVREPDVVFVPTILVIRNSLVGFTKTDVVMLKNNETESLKFEFRGNSLCNESGKTPVTVEPDYGTLRPLSETPIKIFYTPIEDGPLSFKIFCNIKHLTKHLTLCVNALSYEIKPKVTYHLIGNEHILNSDAITNIHLDQTASTYERRIVFTIKNDGSVTFFFEWHYVTSAVKKYLQIRVEPKKGHVTPANKVDCTLYFTLKQVPVQAFPVTLSISDGPEYSIYLYAEIEKPLYHFSCTEYNFGKCIVNAPDTTYKKNLAFINDDKVPLNLDLNFTSLPELYVDYNKLPYIGSEKRHKIPIYFRPKQVKEYEFKLQFWVNSLCEEIITIKGEGVPLLFDLYQGCQKSFDLGPVKVGEKIIRTIEVMNYSKVPIEASFIFRDMYPSTEDTTNSETTSVCLSPTAANVQALNAGSSRGKMLQNYKDDQKREQISMDIQNALSSLKVFPNRCAIKPHRKVPLKIQFKPVGMISDLNVQLNMKVFNFERPLVRLIGSATGMKFCFSQDSLQFGRVRKRGCKILKVMLLNKGDFGAKFWWQPLKSDEFVISPQQGNVAARANVTFTITFRPKNHNPFIKVWASCNIENYKQLELALYGTCVDIGNVENKTLYLECPVREIHTEYIVVTNPSDDTWLVLSEVSGGPFDTLKEFNIEPNSTFNIPVNFKPKSIGKHEAQVLFSPLGESALFVSLIGAATHPNPNGTISFIVPAKDAHTEELLVYNMTEVPETYVVSTELVKVIPDKFEGYYEIKFPETVKVWGEAAATCHWTYVCYEECEMHLKVMFVNVESREYQYYDIKATVKPSCIVDTLNFISRARESIQKELMVTNPLSKDAEFNIRCEKLQCPEKLKIGRNSEATLVMTYSPLVVGETEDVLEINNYLIGSYIYKIVTKCLPAKEKTLEVTTDFGTSIPLRLKVQNKTNVKAEFSSLVSHSSVQAEKNFVLGPFEKGKFLVWFEPTELGVQNCKVSFNSSVAGEFIFNIKGIATEPKPQGPFEIKTGGFTTIMFKNVFEDTRMFKIFVDREEFYVKASYESIKSKKDLKISVFLSDNQQNISEMPTGSLTVETYDPADPKVQWTFFLHGIS